MSELNKDSIVDCLFTRPEMKLRNIRFARGTDVKIEVEDFRAAICSAADQVRGGELSEAGWPKVTKGKVDVRDFVANI